MRPSLYLLGFAMAAGLLIAIGCMPNTSGETLTAVVVATDAAPTRAPVEPLTTAPTQVPATPTATERPAATPTLEPTAAPQPTQAPTEVDETPKEAMEEEIADWGTYTNDTYGYALRYPPECTLGPLPAGCKQTQPQDRPTECLCFLNSEDPDRITMQAFTGGEGDLTLATFSVTRLAQDPAAGTSLMDYVTGRVHYNQMPDEPNAGVGPLPAVRFYAPQSPQAPSRVDIYFIKDGKALQISMLDVNNESSSAFYDRVSSALDIAAEAPTPPPHPNAPMGLSELGRIAFMSNLHLQEAGPQIYVMDADGANPLRLTTQRGPMGPVSWSPDGTQLAFVQAGDVWAMNADGSNARNLTDSESGDGEPAWSPDGRRIAFSSNRAMRQAGQAYAVDIFVMDADGSAPRNLTDSASYDSAPAWSPDGQQIVFQSDRDGNQEIYLMNADGSNPRNLTQHEADEFQPAWSPDGTTIAFDSDRDGDREIYVVNVDGTSLQRLTDSSGIDGLPTWSSDGHYIAFQSDRGGEGQQIHVMRSDGSDVQRLTDQRGYMAAWSPVDHVEPVATAVYGWVGTIAKLPPGSQLSGYFERDDGERFGISSKNEATRQQVEQYRWNGAQVQVWGQLLSGVPDVEGRQIQVERIEALSGAATEARNLSPFATLSSSSTLASDRWGTYQAWSAIDGLLSSPWVEDASGPGIGEWIMLTFPDAIEAHRIGVDVGYDRDEHDTFRSPNLFSANNRVKRATLKFSNGDELQLSFDDARGVQMRHIAAITTTFVQLVIDEVYPGSQWDDTCIAELEVWGVTE